MRDYTVLEAEGGEEALEILRREESDISAVLLDIIMPVMDGFEVLEQMHADPVLSQIPVIVITTATETEVEKKALALGASDFITKPIDADVLKRRLCNLVRLREAAAAVSELQRDELTGLLNRAPFFEQAAAMIASKPEGYYYISSIDIDNFKLINDQYGTKKGDEVLVSFATQVSKDCLDGSLCGRIFADNLITIIPTHLLPTDTAEQQRRAALRVESIIMPVVISIGRYIVVDKSLGISAMYDRARIAQSTIKGRYDTHIALFEESMRDDLLREQEVVDEMQEALRGGQFVPWFQPQYNHASGALVGAEALARWEHPVRGLVPPCDFIPVFERNGFVYELDKCIWEQTCAYIRKWMDEGRNPLSVSVNISRYGLFRDDLSDVLLGLLEKYDLPIHMLRLEITESAFAESSQQVVSVVKKLIDHGFTLEIDDFGSGYSSLNTLKDVPAHVLKFDMGFLETMADPVGALIDGPMSEPVGGVHSESSTRGGNILEAIVRMSKWLGMSIIAEGVEELEQADYLKSIGCDYIQGYYYARPMPAYEYEVLAKQAAKEKRIDALETVQNLDNNSFWDPRSLDTLMFNSYVGAACILEFHRKKITVLRVTSTFRDLLDGIGINIEDAMGIDWGAHMQPEVLAALSEAVVDSMEQRDNVIQEILFTGLPGCAETVYLRCSLRAIAAAGDRYMIYCLGENTTAQHEAEQRERETAARLQAIMEGINGGVSATVVRNGSIERLFANEKFYSILGYTQEQFEAELPTGMRDLIFPDDAPNAEGKYFKHMESDDAMTTNDFRVYRRDGSVIWLHVEGSICHFEGIEQPVNLAVYTDVTRQKTAVDTAR